MLKTSRITGILLSLLMISITDVSAYQQTSKHTTKTKIASISLNNVALGELKEGETKIYTKSTVPKLEDAVSITTQETNVCLHLNSDLNSMTSYSVYNITVKFSIVPDDSNYSPGDIACTLSKALPDSLIELDREGNWTFDFEITASASSVSSDMTTIVSLIVYAESTS